MTFACLTPGTARAQGISGAVYDDARDIIEELITKDVVESAVPIIACRAPELAPYYSKTFLTIYGRRFANLRQVMSDETSAAVAHVVSKTLLGQPLFGAISAEPSDLTVRVVPTSGKTTSDLDQCYKEAKSQLASRRFPSPPFERAVEVDITCAAGRQGSSRYACEIGIATSMALQGKYETAEEHLRRAGAMVLTDVLVASMKQVTVGGASWKLAGSEEKIFERVVVTLRDAGTNADMDLTERLAAAIARVVAPREHVTAASDQLKKDLAQRFSALDRLPTQWRAAMSDGHLDPFAFLSLVAGPSGALKELCTPPVQSAAPQPAAPQPAAPQPAPAQPAAPQPAAPQPAPAEPTAMLPQVCEAVGRGVVPQVWGYLSPILQAAVRRDHASLAIGVIHPLFPETPECKHDPKSDECTQSTVYARFTENVASYVLEAADSGEPSAATRAALKSAAVDLLDELGQRKGSGIDRGAGWKILVPDLALRYGWSGSFLNEATGNGARFYASVDWLTFRARLHRGEYAYVAAQLSLADLIGPFSEIALRKNVNTGYDRDEEVWLNFVRPRLDVLYGVPAFSRRLTLATSFAARAASPYAKADETYTYTPIWKDLTGETDMKSYWSRFFEFGFAIKYVL